MQLCMCRCTVHMHFCTQHHTVQHSMVLCILDCPAWLLSLMLTHRHQSLQRCQRDNHCRYVVYTACHALSPRAFQTPECVQAKKKSLQVCCTVLVMLCGLQRAAKNKNDTRRRAADMPSSCWDNRGVLGIYRSVPTKQKYVIAFHRAATEQTSRNSPHW